MLWNSWPTTFGISFGLTTLTLGWVGTYLPVRPTVGWLAAGLLGVATSYEVAWVVVQHARGVPAHFNDTTVLDERLFIGGAVMVAIAILVIAAMTLAAFVRTTAPAPLDLANRAGLVGLLAAQATGLWMLLHGLALVALAVLGYAGLFGVALLRTTSGRTPVELRDASILGYLLAAAFLAAPAVAAVTAVSTHYGRAPFPKSEPYGGPTL